MLNLCHPSAHTAHAADAAHALTSGPYLCLEREKGGVFERAHAKVRKLWCSRSRQHESEGSRIQVGNCCCSLSCWQAALAISQCFISLATPTSLLAYRHAALAISTPDSFFKILKNHAPYNIFWHTQLADPTVCAHMASHPTEVCDTQDISAHTSNTYSAHEPHPRARTLTDQSVSTNKLGLFRSRCTTGGSQLQQ